MTRIKVAADGGVHDVVDAGQRVRVLGACLVEVGEVDAEASFAVGLGHHDGVGDPVGMRDLTDELGLLELLYFLNDEVLLFGRLSPRLLLHGSLGHTARWCSITSLGTPGISDGGHANMLAFFRRKATSALSYLERRLPPMVMVAPEPLASRDTFFVAVRSWENS